MAFKIYLGQTLYNIVLRQSRSLTGATSAKVLYRKPSGEAGEWTGATTSGTQVTYRVQSGDFTINDSGVWTFQAEVVINGETLLTKPKTKELEILNPIN